MAARMKEKYTTEIAPALLKKFGYKSLMQIPSWTRSLSTWAAARARTTPRRLRPSASDIATITGQKPITTKARKSVANFKVREGETVGVKVTLRGDKM